MSKLTSEEIIASGDYLEPGFEPAKLTVPLLRGILQHHDVDYGGTKPQLVKAFEENIVPNAAAYRKRRRDIAAIRSDASDIVDGATGEFIEAPQTRRRISRQSTMETLKRVPSASPTRKSRKSIATPRTSSKLVRAEYEQDSESERMASSTLSNAEQKARKPRRVSQKWGTGDDKSLWEDNNPFQRSETAAEDVELSRSVSKPRKSRARPSEPVFAPSAPDQSIFPVAGSLNLDAYPTSTRKNRHSETPARTKASETPSTPYEYDRGDETLQESYEENGYPHVDGDSQNDIITDKIASFGKSAANGTLIPKIKAKSSFGWRHIVSGLLVALTSTALYSYKKDSAELGYCDAGKNTNVVVIEHLMDIEMEKACKEAIIRRADAGLGADPNMESCKTAILPRATYCTPCPAHAVCSVHTVTCEPAYILKHSTFSSIPFLDAALDGFPGLGSKALPVQCVADVRRRQHVGKMAGAIEKKLASVRGERICEGITSTGGDAQDAAAYGMTVDEIKNSLTKRLNPKAIRNFDEILEQAIIELRNNKLLVSVRDISGQEHFASIRELVSYTCQAKLATLRTWNAWKWNIIGSIALSLLFFTGRSSFTKRALERRRVKALVKEALERVKEQEARHYLDSVTYPTQALSSLQLRDEMMADEHSIATRVRIWEQVERIVEGNTNVRSNMEITTSGDEGRVWTWIGAGGGRSPGGRQVL